MKKILCACGNGMGSSLMIKIKVEKVLEKLGIDGKVDTSSIGEAKGIADNYDVVLCSTYLEEDLDDCSAFVVGLENLMDEAQIEIGLKQAFNI
ncbi:PTS system enzyme IIB component [Spiroplasma clarkii]|uniref:PTS system, ascorbate-specific IIB component n=1 Tax=Spiroplasma clarkii TaxID=2139 RepID=A0A1Y0L1P1_9MOLU|nr:PTS sugar transporter subunit IIB [Spiroplasma clarkii]ARU91897.1 PTS system enzyme IIB component [Spiroplasma clarkii]ATX71244.1 PTS system, ascorbate-specific IIB component [Spiroplasma clarkii]